MDVRQEQQEMVSRVNGVKCDGCGKVKILDKTVAGEVGRESSGSATGCSDQVGHLALVPPVPRLRSGDGSAESNLSRTGP